MSLLLNGGETEYFEMYSATATPIQEVFNQVIIRMRHLLEFENLEKLNYAELLNILIRVTIATVRLRKEATIGRYQLVAEQELDKTIFLIASCSRSLIIISCHCSRMNIIISIVIHSDTIHQQDVMKLVENVIYKVSKAINHSFIKIHNC